MINVVAVQEKNIKTAMALSNSLFKVSVVVGIIYELPRSKLQRILLTKRGHNKNHPGKWELPGGKVATNELAEHALCREIKEEIGLQIISFQLFTEFEYRYPNSLVELKVYKINDYQGTAKCCEDQLDLQWVLPQDLHKYDLLEANARIIDLLK